MILNFVLLFTILFFHLLPTIILVLKFMYKCGLFYEITFENSFKLLTVNYKYNTNVWRHF